jgi:hypothetical protein
MSKEKRMTRAHALVLAILGGSLLGGPPSVAAPSPPRSHRKAELALASFRGPGVAAPPEKALPSGRGGAAAPAPAEKALPSGRGGAAATPPSEKALPAGGGGAPPTEGKTELTEEAIFARFKHEPLVQEVQEAAIRYYQVHPDRIGSLRLNAQLKALMPTLDAKFSNSLYTTKRNMADGLYYTLPFKENEQTNGDSIGFTVGATWNLDKIVFNAEVLDVQSLIGILDGVVREVTTVYYIRRRLQIDSILRPPTDLASKISEHIRVEELTGLLDAMTGGFMSKRIKAMKQDHP